VKAEKTALLMAYRFPPQGGGGSLRTLKFTKYLREFGWEPVVHTARDPFWPVTDDTLLHDVPEDVHVYRTRTFEFERLEQRLATIFKQHDERGTSRQPVDRPSGKAPRRPGLSETLRAQVHRRLLVPDPQIAWLPGAFLHGLKIARREAPRVLYTSSPPNSTQLLGALLAAAVRKPWVADFRDPWTDGMRRRQAYAGNRLRGACERAAERLVVRRADRIVVTAEPLRARFLAKYPFLAPERVVVLTNGYDPADFTACTGGARELESDRFHLTGAGNIEAMFDARPLLRAVAELIAEHPGFRADLLVNLVGAKKGQYDADIQALGLTDRVRYVGWVPHAQSLRYLHQSDVLLMCAITQPSGQGEKFPAKGFEYLYLRKPVLCLSAPGVTTELLARSGLGTVVDPADLAGIKAALRTFYERRHQPARGDAAFIARFDRRCLTEKLAGIFDELVGAPSRASVAA